MGPSTTTTTDTLDIPPPIPSHPLTRKKSTEGLAPPPLSGGPPRSDQQVAACLGSATRAFRNSHHKISQDLPHTVYPAAVEGIGDHMGRGQSTWRVRAMVDRSRARRRRCGLRISGRVVARAAAVMVPCLLCEGEKGRERKAGQDRASCVTGAEEPIQLAPKTTPYKGRLRRWSTVHPGSRRYRGFLRSHFGPKAP